MIYVHNLKNYPKSYTKIQRKNRIKLQNLNTIILGIGGNFSQTPRVFENLFRTLKKHKKIFSLRTTPILQNPAFGYTNQNDFQNAIITLQSSLNLSEIYTLVFYLERRFGRAREREFKNAPRILDIDIIFFNDLILRRTWLTIPHIFWHQRISVCLPLSFLF